MNDIEMRIAIAKACGWECVHAQPEWESGDKLRGMPPKSNLRDRVPDYLNDLNACREMEKTLDSNGQIYERNMFAAELQKLVHPEQHLNIQYLGWCLAHATARQRAKAFLRCKGLWKEEHEPISG